MLHRWEVQCRNKFVLFSIMILCVYERGDLAGKSAEARKSLLN